MNLQGIKPENIQFNVKDKISIPKSTQGTIEDQQETIETSQETTEKSSCGCSTSDKIEKPDSDT